MNVPMAFGLSRTQKDLSRIGQNGSKGRVSFFRMREAGPELLAACRAKATSRIRI